MAPARFGAKVRRERKRLRIGLREAAKKIGVSPAYLSMVERSKFPPPSEEKVRVIATLLAVDADELLALAGKISSDLADIIKKNPRDMASLLRSVTSLTADQLSDSIERESKATKVKK